MSTTLSDALMKRFYRPAKTPVIAEPEIRDELPWAIGTLKAVQTIPAELAGIDQEQSAIEALLEVAKSRQQQLAERRLNVDRLRADGLRATPMVLRAMTTEPAEEKDLTEFGCGKLSEGGEMQARYHLNLVKMVASEETAEHKELQALVADLADCDATIKRDANPHQHPGLSAAEHRRRRLQVDVANLQPKVDAYAHTYAKWREIQKVKQEAADAFAKRDELRPNARLRVGGGAEVSRFLRGVRRLSAFNGGRCGVFLLKDRHELHSSAHCRSPHDAQGNRLSRAVLPGRRQSACGQPSRVLGRGDGLRTWRRIHDRADVASSRPGSSHGHVAT